MKILDYNYSAFTIFDRIEFADKQEESMSSPCSMGAVPRQAKAFLPIIPLVSTIKQRPDYRGFFVCAVMDTSDNGLESVSFHVKTGWYLPEYSKPRSVGERLHNSIEPKRQNGQSWIISTRHAHLVSDNRYGAVVKSILSSLAPLSNLLSK